MTILREAAQMALDALEHGLPIIEDFGGKEQLQLQHKAIAVLYEALRAALAQPEQEPVAWIDWDEEGWAFLTTESCGVPLYRTPPQREWQGLTDEDREEIDKWIEFKEAGGNEPVPAQKLITYVEAKLREKNA